jgi:hypothetical protein
MKDDQKRPILSGRLQIRKLHLDIVNTGYFRVEVTPINRETVGETVLAETTGQKVSVSNIGTVPLLSGRVECTVMAKSQGTLIDIVNDTYLPCFIQTGELEGFYWNRSKNRSS